MRSTFAQTARARETRFFRALLVLQGKSLLADDAARVLSRTKLPIRVVYSDMEEVVVVGRRQNSALTDVLEVGGEELLCKAALAGGAAVTRYL